MCVSFTSCCCASCRGASNFRKSQAMCPLSFQYQARGHLWLTLCSRPYSCNCRPATMADDCGTCPMCENKMLPSEEPPLGMYTLLCTREQRRLAAYACIIGGVSALFGGVSAQGLQTCTVRGGPNLSCQTACSLTHTQLRMAAKPLDRRTWRHSPVDRYQLAGNPLSHHMSRSYSRP